MLRKCALLLSLGLGACGYTVRQDDLTIGALAKDRPGHSGRQRIFVPVVDNLSSRTGVEAQLTSAIRETLAGVRGAEVVESENDADYLLLGTLTQYNRRFGPNVAQGSADSVRRGGLQNQQITASNIAVSLTLEVKLLERFPGQGGMRRLVWGRSFTQGGIYDASTRFSEASGASSAPHINASRELIQVRGLSETLAQQIVDQVAQDF